MLYLTLAKARSSSRERIARRLEYRYPDGLTVLGEYWTFGDDPAVVLITEGDDPATLMQATGAWDDVFDFTIVPVITAEEGLRIARDAVATPVTATR